MVSCRFLERMVEVMFPKGVKRDEPEGDSLRSAWFLESTLGGKGGKWKG